MPAPPSGYRSIEWVWTRVGTSQSYHLPGSVQDRKVSGRQRSLHKGVKRKRELKVPEAGKG